VSGTPFIGSLTFVLQTSSVLSCTVEPGYNDIGLYDTSPITSDIMWYQLIPRW